ncbi:MAG: DNA polymerase III subunit delta [Rickettsiales bacterium]|nr:MAG: DNA polymerase III subunit delta [Rickettsiales bacterium]
MKINQIESGYDYKCVIIYGDALGKVRENKSKFLEKIMPDYRTNIGFIDITNTLSKIATTESTKDEEEKTGILFTEFNTMSLFAEQKVITLDIPFDSDKTTKERAKTCIKDVDAIFSDELKSNAIVLITADYSFNGVFKGFENKDNIAVLPCFEDTERDIKMLITDKLKDFNLENGIIEYISQSLIDRAIITNELEKLILYVGDTKNITLNDVKNCIQDETEADISDFVNAVANLDFNASQSELEKFLNNGESSITLIRFLISHFLKLQLYRYKIDNGANLNDLEKSPMAWKTKPILQAQLSKLSLNNINFALNLFLNEEKRAKGQNI